MPNHPWNRLGTSDEKSLVFAYRIGFASKVLWMRLEGSAEPLQQIPATLETKERVLVVVDLKSLAKALQGQIAKTIGYFVRQQKKKMIRSKMLVRKGSSGIVFQLSMIYNQSSTNDNHTGMSMAKGKRDEKEKRKGCSCSEAKDTHSTLTVGKERKIKKGKKPQTLNSAGRGRGEKGGGATNHPRN